MGKQMWGETTEYSQLFGMNISSMCSYFEPQIRLGICHRLIRLNSTAPPQGICVPQPAHHRLIRSPTGRIISPSKDCGGGKKTEDFPKPKMETPHKVSLPQSYLKYPMSVKEQWNRVKKSIKLKVFNVLKSINLSVSERTLRRCFTTSVNSMPDNFIQNVKERKFQIYFIYLS